jgi:hypothetical protein
VADQIVGAAATVAAGIEGWSVSVMRIMVGDPAGRRV